MSIRHTLAPPPPLSVLVERLTTLQESSNLFGGSAADSAARGQIAVQQAREIGLPDLAYWYASTTSAPQLQSQIRVDCGLAPHPIPTPPAVSLYIPSFNSGHYLRKILPAVLHQSIPAAEIFIVDDGSQDDTQAIAREFHMPIWGHRENRGLAAARNTGLSAAAHELVACVDSDVAPDYFWLERLLDRMKDPSIAAAGGRLIEEFTLSVPDRWRARMMPQHYGDDARTGINIFGCNGIVRRSIARAIGGYQPQFRSSYEDTDFSDRLKAHGHQTAYVPLALCRHLKHDSARSVVNTCFGWRAPHLRGLGAFNSLPGFQTALTIGLRHDLRELEELAASGAKDLSYLSALLLFRSPFLSFEYFSKNVPDLDLREEKRLLSQLMRGSLEACSTKPPLHALLLNDLEDFMEPVCLMTPPQGDTTHSPDELNGDLSAMHSLNRAAIATALNASLSDLPDILRFSPELLEALTQSAQACSHERHSEILTLRDAHTLRILKRRDATTAHSSITFSVGLKKTALVAECHPSGAHPLHLLERLAGAQVWSGAREIEVELPELAPLHFVALALLLRAAVPDASISLKGADCLDLVQLLQEPLFDALRVNI